MWHLFIYCNYQHLNITNNNISWRPITLYRCTGLSLGWHLLRTRNVIWRMERSKTRFNWLVYILTLVYRDTALVSVLQEAGVFDTKSQTCIRQTDAILEQCIYRKRENRARPLACLYSDRMIGGEWYWLVSASSASHYAKLMDVNKEFHGNHSLKHEYKK